MNFEPINDWFEQKVLIVVKTYPSPSMRYQETVCTAGITDKGKWVRLYPISFRYLPFERQYKKFQWIKLNIKKQVKDFRPESFLPDNDSIKALGELSTKKDKQWKARKDILLPLANKSLEEISIQYNENKTSLGIFKPREVTDFYWKDAPEEWSEKHEEVLKQGVLFGTQPKPLEKIPLEFRYKFRCDDHRCKGHDLSIIDWEIYEAYRNWRNRYDYNTLLIKIREKWLDKFWHSDRDSYFIVGSRFPYPTFMILGIFWPPK